MSDPSARQNSDSLKTQIQEILELRLFDRLAPLVDSVNTNTLTPEEKDLLAYALITHGEDLLKEGDSGVLHNFSLAQKIAHDLPKALYQQAFVFATQEENMKYLKEACSLLHRVTTLKPDFYEAWYTWGCILMSIGSIDGVIHYLQEAHQKFIKALQTSNEVKESALKELYWQWALCWTTIGKFSGEACDYHYALDYYTKAAQDEIDDSAFWNDYGTTIIELGKLLNRHDLINEGITLFQKAIQICSEDFQGWYNLGQAYKRLFEQSRDEEDFNLANTSFAKAADLDFNHITLWMSWGEILMDAGKELSNLEYMELSCEKFVRANECDPNNSIVLSFWAESQIRLASQTERLDLLKSAEEKIIHSLELNSDYPDAWQVYGACLMELGRYFSDPSYSHLAIEKFKYGLVLDQKHPSLWYGLALAYFTLGETSGSFSQIEESLSCFAKAVLFTEEDYPQLWSDWGVALMELGELKQEENYIVQAIEKFEHALSIGSLTEANETQKNFGDNPHIEALYHFGCCLDSLGNFREDTLYYEKAIQVFTEVLQHDPLYTYAKYNLALAYSHLGELTDQVDFFYKAIENFQTLLSEDPEDESSWNECGLACTHLARLIYEPAHPEQALKLYKHGEEKFLNAISLGNTSSLYYLAGLHSLTGNYNLAMHFIERAEKADSLPPIDEIMADDWLEGLRQTDHFRNFINLIESQEDKDISL